MSKLVASQLLLPLPLLAIGIHLTPLLVVGDIISIILRLSFLRTYLYNSTRDYVCVRVGYYNFIYYEIVRKYFQVR